jgi:diguanylate cyclase (GGDEF)-like protein
VHPDDHDIGIANWIDMLDSPGPGRRVRLRHQHRDGHWLWLEITNHNRLHDPEHGDVVADMVDISEEMAAQEALRAREHLLFELTQAVPLGLFYCAPDGEVVFANQKLSEFLAVEAIEKLSDLVDAVHGEDVPTVRRALSTTLAGQGDSDIELRISSPVDQRYGSLRLRTILSPEGAPSGVIGCLEDVTDGVLRRRRLEARATVDPLTGCLNRDSAMAVLTSTIGGLQEDGNSGLAVVYLDLDRFKPINDAYGHATGDGLLTEVAERLRQSIRAGDKVGRVGGDEFIVICSSVATARDALRIGEAISDRVCQVAVVSGHEIPVRASTGVVWTDRAVSDPDLLVGAADAAMYRSKRGAACRAVLGDPMQLKH